jgi:c-di-GMP-binding flagellar brake protein YcgR
MTGELVKTKEILKIGQRVEFYVEGDDNRYASRIEDINEDMLEVAMPMSRSGVPIIPREDEKIYGVAVGHQCRYRFFTTYKGKGRKDDRIPIYYFCQLLRVNQEFRLVSFPVNLPWANVNIR